jgi:hypothetical protein
LISILDFLTKSFNFFWGEEGMRRGGDEERRG